MYIFWQSILFMNYATQGGGGGVSQKMTLGEGPNIGWRHLWTAPKFNYLNYKMKYVDYYYYLSWQSDQLFHPLNDFFKMFLYQLHSDLLLL